MHKTLPPSTKLLSATLTLVLVGSLVGLPATASTCYGSYYEDYNGPSHDEIRRSQGHMPGFSDQIDYDKNGNYVETPRAAPQGRRQATFQAVTQNAKSATYGY